MLDTETAVNSELEHVVAWKDGSHATDGTHFDHHKQTELSKEQLDAA